MWISSSRLWEYSHRQRTKGKDGMRVVVDEKVVVLLSYVRTYVCVSVCCFWARYTLFHCDFFSFFNFFKKKNVLLLAHSLLSFFICCLFAYVILCMCLVLDFISQVCLLSSSNTRTIGSHIIPVWLKRRKVLWKTLSLSPCIFFKRKIPSPLERTQKDLRNK